MNLTESQQATLAEFRRRLLDELPGPIEISEPTEDENGDVVMYLTGDFGTVKARCWSKQ